MRREECLSSYRSRPGSARDAGQRAAGRATPTWRSRQCQEYDQSCYKSTSANLCKRELRARLALGAQAVGSRLRPGASRGLGPRNKGGDGGGGGRL